MKKNISKVNRFTIKPLSKSVDFFASGPSVEIIFAIGSDDVIPPLKIFLNRTQLKCAQQSLEGAVAAKVFGFVKFASVVKIIIPEEVRYLTKQKIHFVDAIDLEKVFSTNLGCLYDIFDGERVFRVGQEIYLPVNPSKLKFVGDIQLILNSDSHPCRRIEFGRNSFLALTLPAHTTNARTAVLRLFSASKTNYIDFDVQEKFSELMPSSSTQKQSLNEVCEGDKRFSILVLKLDHIGDLLLAINAFKRLRDKFQNERIDIVCGSWNKSFVESLKLFDHVYQFDFFSKRSGDWVGVRGGEAIELGYLISAEIGHYYDVACDFRVDPDTRYLLKGLRAKAKFGFAAPNSANFLTRAIDVNDSHPTLRKLSSYKEVYKADFHPGVPLEDGSVCLMLMDGVVAVCLATDYLKSQFDVEGTGDSRPMSFGVESAQLVQKIGDRTVIVDTADLTQSHSKEFHHNIEDWGFWANSRVVPLFFHFRNVSALPSMELMMKIRVPYFKGETVLKKRVAIFTLDGEYAVDFVSDANSKLVSIPVNVSAARTCYFFSTNAENLPVIDFENFGAREGRIDHTCALLNRFGMIGRYRSVVPDGASQIDYAEFVPSVDIVRRNEVYVLGALSGPSVTSGVVKLSAGSAERSYAPSVSSLQHRSVAFEMLADLVSAEVSSAGRSQLPKVLCSDKKVTIAIGTGANSSARKWPLSHFVSLIRLLLQNETIHIELFGAGEEDGRDAQQITNSIRSKRIANLVGTLPLSKVPEALRKCQIYLGNNSGLGHMAAYSGIPSLIIFSGANESERWRPMAATKIIQKQVECSPCDISVRSACPNSMKCMDLLLPGDVYEQIRKSYPRIFTGKKVESLDDYFELEAT